MQKQEGPGRRTWNVRLLLSNLDSCNLRLLLSLLLHSDLRLSDGPWTTCERSVYLLATWAIPTTTTYYYYLLLLPTSDVETRDPLALVRRCVKESDLEWKEAGPYLEEIGVVPMPPGSGYWVGWENKGLSFPLVTTWISGYSDLSMTGWCGGRASIRPPIFCFECC